MIIVHIEPAGGQFTYLLFKCIIRASVDVSMSQFSRNYKHLHNQNPPIMSIQINNGFDCTGTIDFVVLDGRLLVKIYTQDLYVCVLIIECQFVRHTDL